MVIFAILVGVVLKYYVHVSVGGLNNTNTSLYNEIQFDCTKILQDDHNFESPLEKKKTVSTELNN